LHIFLGGKRLGNDTLNNTISVWLFITKT
jgi:hypothetical protein